MSRFRVVIILLSVSFMIAAVMSQWNRIQSIDWLLRPELLAVSIAGLIVVFFLDAYGWHLILRALGQRVPPITSIRIWLLSSLARYLPGVIWSYASRISMAKEKGISVASSSMSLYLETLLLMASSLAVGFPSLMAAVGIHVNPLAAIFLWILLGLLMHPRILSILRFLPGRMGRGFLTLSLPDVKTIFCLYVYYLVFWVIFGTIFVCFVSGIHPLGPHQWIPVGSSIALGFFLGFILVMFPGGIGVRESALYVLLLPFIPTATTLIVSVGSRIWVMLGEILSLGIIMSLKNKK